MKIFIYAPSYDENSGGAIVLHRLCHIINEHTDEESFIIKLDPTECVEFSVKKILSKFKWKIFNQHKFKINDKWNTPVWNERKLPKDSVIIYPEIVNGNPLGGDHVVRWLLHQPGYHTHFINYSENELYFKFNSAIEDFDSAGSKLSKNELKVIYYPIDIYNMDNCELNRTIESCHLVRKGANKPPVHDDGSIAIDGLTHQEIADIFRRTKKFICYDDYTAYSIFAILCGCKSYVVPDIGKSIEEWYPNMTDRFGISYGFSDEQELWAEQTSHKVLEHIIREHNKSINNTIECIKEIKSNFNI